MINDSTRSETVALPPTGLGPANAPGSEAPSPSPGDRTPTSTSPVGALAAMPAPTPGAGSGSNLSATEPAPSFRVVEVTLWQNCFQCGDVTVISLKPGRMPTVNGKVEAITLHDDVVEVQFHRFRPTNQVVTFLFPFAAVRMIELE